MRTITSAAKELRIGKTKLYSLLAQTGIEPTQQGKSRIIDNAQLQQLQNAIYSCVDPGNDPAGHKKRTTKLSNLDSERSDLHRELVQRMSNEIDHLKDLLTSERTDRQKRENEIATERQNYQQMLMVLQGDMKQLRQQLLEAPTAPAFSVANSAAERDTPVEFAKVAPRPDTPVDFAEESTPQPEAVVSNNVWGSRLTAFGLLGTTMAVITFLVTINNPDLILSKAIASLWQ